MGNFSCNTELSHSKYFVLFPRGAGLSIKQQPESRCPELLANYCDMLLRKTPYSKKLTSEEIEDKLKNVVSSYNYLHCVFSVI